jgi:hypothetical protein
MDYPGLLIASSKGFAAEPPDEHPRHRIGYFTL